MSERPENADFVAAELRRSLQQSARAKMASPTPAATPGNQGPRVIHPPKPAPRQPTRAPAKAAAGANPPLNNLDNLTPVKPDPKASPNMPKWVNQAGGANNPQYKEEPAAPLPPLPPITAPQWNYLPLPASEPDPHTEFDERSGTSPEKLPIIGARVRGKKHKHDGTHCDDWMHFGATGPWTILAVSDGGGSYKFSRVGAKAACETAVATLKDKLAQHKLEDRATWDAASFSAPDVAYLYDALVAAMIDAYAAVKAAVDERAGDPAYEAILGRPLTVKDLYCTLLVAIHTTIKFGGGERNLILSCAVGDGMVAAVDQAGDTILLMTPDSGEHSGEVRFLDEKETEPGKLRGKIFPSICNLRALLLMTDGVADDYFPNKPGMSWLYGDLVLNGILPPPPSDKTLAEALTGTNVSEAEFAKLEPWSEVEIQESEAATRKTKVKTVALLADKLGLAPEEVVKRPAILAAGAKLGEPISADAAAEMRARVWLDSYHVRGSFDDRTLLVMHK